MKVRVTKDTFGVAVWPMEQAVVYGGPMQQPVWMVDGFAWSQDAHMLLSRKVVARFMPNLGADIPEGESREMELTIGG